MNESVGFVDKLRQLLSSWGLYDECSINPFAIWKFLDALDNGDAFISGFFYTLEVSILALLIVLVLGTIGGVMATS